jgi:hypothetical protein
LQLILLAIINPGIACSKYMNNLSNFGHELVLSPIAASMLNLFYSKIIKSVYLFGELLILASLLWLDVLLLHY